MALSLEQPLYPFGLVKPEQGEACRKVGEMRLVAASLFPVGLEKPHEDRLAAEKGFPQRLGVAVPENFAGEDAAAVRPKSRRSLMPRL